MKHIGIIIVLLLSPSVCLCKSLYVSTQGNDSTSYISNDIKKPWKTPGKAFTSALAGDIVYFRGGTYAITSTIKTRDGNHDGKRSKPITFTSYPGETAIFSTSLSQVVYIDNNYYYIERIKFRGGGNWFAVGYNRSHPANYFKVSECTVNMIKGGDNVAFVKFYGDGVLVKKRANNGIVESCTITGPGTGSHANTSAVLIFRSKQIKIKNNEITGFPRAIYYKHTNEPQDDGIEITGNYLYGNTYGIFFMGQYATIKNNLLVGNPIYLGNCGESGPFDGKNNCGSDYNIIEHNTVYRSYIKLKRSSDGDGSGAQYNVIRNNVITGSSLNEIFRYSSKSHYTNMDYNLYKTGNIVYVNRVKYTLSSWKSQQSYGAKDANSKSDTPIFIGGSSPSSILGYTLADGSPGKGDASDGSDMGADMSQVGPDA